MLVDTNSRATRPRLNAMLALLACGFIAAPVSADDAHDHADHADHEHTHGHAHDQDEQVQEPEADEASQPAEAAEDVDEQTKFMRMFSYAIGHQIGSNLASQDIQVDPVFLADGVSAAFGLSEERLDAQQRQLILMQFQQMMMAKQMQRMEQEGSTNLEQGVAYLEANKLKEGVVTTDSGLQYRVIEMGEGIKPSAADTVTVHYRGTLTDGTQFDSSYDRGEPATFPLNAVIPGWTEGVQLMPVGSTFEFVIPSELAYGPNGSGGRVGPNATLIFQVELLGIE